MTRDRDAERVAELEGRIEALGLMLEVTMQTLLEIAERVDASLPIPIPENMITIKKAALAANYSLPTMYRFHQQGIINSSKPTTKGQTILVGRDTLAACIAAHLAKRKKRK